MSRLVVSARDSGFVRWAQSLSAEQIGMLLGESSPISSQVNQMVESLLAQVKADYPKVLDRENVQIGLKLIALLQPFGEEGTKSLASLLEYSDGKVLGAAIRSVALANAAIAALEASGELETLVKARLMVVHKSVLDSLNISIQHLEVQANKSVLEILTEGSSIYKKELKRQKTALELSIASPTWLQYQEWRLEHETSPLSQRLIWLCSQGTREFAIGFTNGEWNSIDGRGVHAAGSRMQLWHPLGRPPDEIELAKNWLLASGITQPFPQVFREAFVFDPCSPALPESVLLKQADFARAAKARGWKYRQLGAYSPDVPALASRKLGFTQFEWHIERFEHAKLEAHDYFDVVRSGRFFVRLRNREVGFQQVLPRLLSEVLRDVDGILTEASVGLDSFWQRRHPDREWQAYLESRRSIESTKTTDTRTDILRRFGLANCYVLGSEVQIGKVRISLSTGESNQMVSAGVESVRMPHEGDSVLQMILHKTLAPVEGDGD